MQLGTRLVSKGQKEAKSDEQKHMSVTKQDAVLVDKTLDAFKNVKASVAREILSNPKNLKRLLVHDSKNPVVCFYVLHALFMVLAFRETNHEEFLNTISDENIAILRELILVAQTRIRPNSETLKKMIEQRKGKRFVPESREAIENKAMIASSCLGSEVAKYWEDATTELNDWLDSIDNFKRETVSDTNEEILTSWWTTKELAEKLGCKNTNIFYMKKCELLKQHPVLAGEINSWFEHKGVKKLFNPKCFPELKTLWNETVLQQKSKVTHGRHAKKSSRTPKASLKTVASPKSENATIAPASQIVGNAQMPKAKPGRKPKKAKAETPKTDKELKTLVDVKAFETFLKELKQACNNALEDLEDKEKSYRTLASEILETEDLDTRTDLLNQVTTANDAVKNSKTKFQTLTTKFSEGAQLLLQQQQAEKVLKQVTAKIEDFIIENQQFMK